MAKQPSFTPALFDFLRELRENNNREWFQRNRQRYEDDVRGPALRFIAEVAPEIHSISPHLVADPRPVGGSLFRINRDTRFSADKSPYKTAAAMSFAHERGRHGGGPGYYLQLAPGEVFAGGGVYMPDTATLTRIRDAIVADPDAWSRIVDAPEMAQRYATTGPALKRVPAGYDAAHPRAEDLKRKSHIWHTTFSEQQACVPGFKDRYLDACRAAAPLHRFLAKALGVPW